MPDPITVTDAGVTVAVWVVPGSSRCVVDGLHGSRLKIRVTAPPEGGRANKEVARLLRDLLGGEVRLQSGMRARSKVFAISPADVATVRRKLGL